jgi:hypothetical protein
VHIPVLLVAATLVEAAPPAAQLATRRRPRGGRAWLLVWCGFLFIMDLWGFWTSLHGERNLWLWYISKPGSVALVLWTLSYWQPGDTWRLTYRLAIVPFLAVWGTLTWLVEDTSAYSAASVPMATLIALAAAATVLIVRSHRSATAVWRQDWFWIAGGMTMYFGTSATLSPLGAVLVPAHAALFTSALLFKAFLDVVAFLLITWGVLCPPTP